MARESVSEFQQKAAIRDIGHQRRVSRETRASRGTSRQRTLESKEVESHRTVEFGRRRNKYVASGAETRRNIRINRIAATEAESNIRLKTATQRKQEAAEIQLQKESITRSEQAKASRGQARGRFTRRVAGSAASGAVGSNVFKILLAFVGLSILLLVVSHGQQGGTAIQQIGDKLSRVTTNQPLFQVSA